MILIYLLLLYKIYKIAHYGYFLRVHAIICSIQNETETPHKWPGKWPGIFVCSLLELDICKKEKKLMQTA